MQDAPGPYLDHNSKPKSSSSRTLTHHIYLKPVCGSMGPFTAAVNRSPDYLHIVLISTGSVASIKIPLIVKELLQVCSLVLPHSTEPDGSYIVVTVS